MRMRASAMAKLIVPAMRYAVIRCLLRYEGPWSVSVQGVCRMIAAALAVRRSLELHELVDFEEVMFLLEELAAMRREDAIAAPFLPRFTTKDSAVQRVLDFDKVQ